MENLSDNWFIISRFIWMGYRDSLKFNDFTDLLERDKCSHLVPKFYRHWNDELIKCRYKSFLGQLYHVTRSLIPFISVEDNSTHDNKIPFIFLNFSHSFTDIFHLFQQRKVQKQAKYLPSCVANCWKVFGSSCRFSALLSDHHLHTTSRHLVSTCRSDVIYIPPLVI